MSEWQPIETAPLDGTRVDLWDGVCRRPVCHFDGNHWIEFQARFHGVPRYVSGFKPTHWMPLPAPPEEPA